MSKTKRYLSILLCLVLLCTTLIPMYAFAADDTLQILCDGVIVSGNDKTPMHIKETEQKQLSVLFNGSETLPEGTQVRCLHRRRISRMWMKRRCHRARQLQGRNLARLGGYQYRLPVAHRPGLADMVYGWFDEYEIDQMDTEGIVNVLEVGLKPVLGEETAKNLAESLRKTLNSINVEIQAVLVNAETGEELVSSSTHVVVDNNDSISSMFIPNGTYITNHDAVPQTVEVGYSMDMEGITTPLRLHMGVNWEVTKKIGNLDWITLPTGDATIDAEGHVTFLKPGTYKITAKPDTEGLYQNISKLIDQFGGIAHAGTTIASVITELFGLTVSQTVIDALGKTIQGILDANQSDQAETLRKIITVVGNFILGITINDSVTVTVVEQLDVESFEIFGKLDGLNSYGGTRQLTITNIQPEGAVVKPGDVVWTTNNSNYAVVTRPACSPSVPAETGAIRLRSRRRSTVFPARSTATS